MYLWNTPDGTLLKQLAGHQGVITSVAWSQDGRLLASAGRVRGSGELVVWDAQSGERMRVLTGNSGVVYAVTWGPSGELLVSGGSDGTLRWWNVQSGECVRVHQAHQGRSVRSGEVPMASGWPVVGMTGRSRSGTCTVVNICTRCYVTGPTSASMSPGFED